MCWHKFEEKEIQRTKNMCFGYAGCELPGVRVKLVCKKCGEVKYESLNLTMPNKYLYMNEIQVNECVGG